VRLGCLRSQVCKQSHSRNQPACAVTEGVLGEGVRPGMAATMGLMAVGFTLPAVAAYSWAVGLPYCGKGSQS
jgi:hypothetical protein